MRGGCILTIYLTEFIFILWAEFKFVLVDSSGFLMCPGVKEDDVALVRVSSLER